MERLLHQFEDALMDKCRGDMTAAAAFIESFDRLADEEQLAPKFREQVRRGMFLILKAHVSE